MIRALLFTLFLGFSLSVQAQKDTSSERLAQAYTQSMPGTQANQRPKIGLVLSGGGAKGAAHVGVLQVLEQHRIPVDYIAGTSIGAYVGGMYALGYSATELEAIMLGIDWSQGYSDTIAREALTFRDKQKRDQYNIPIDIGYSEGELKTPSGLLRGQTMSQLLRKSTDLVQQFGHFDELAIPYRAVATDLETSHAVILNNGSIVSAMQASATVPAALQPAQIDGKLLVDGGIANNIPIDVVKGMGADIIIAVDIGSPLVNKDKLNSALAVLDQLSTMLTNASSDRQKLLLTEHDILIRPQIDDLSTTDFSIMPIAFPLGVEAANLHLTRLKDFSLSESEYHAYLQQKQAKSLAWLRQIDRPIVDVVLNNDSKVGESLIRESLDIKPGQVVDTQLLDAAINQLYALDKFERVDAEFVDTQKGRILEVTTKAKSWGPNYFEVGFSWEDDFTLDSAVTLDVAYTLTDLTKTGGEWRSELKMGFEKVLATEFYQPLDLDQLFFVKARYQFEIDNWDYFDEDNNLVFELDKETHSVELGLGVNYTRQGMIEFGVIAEEGAISNDAILATDVDFKSKGAYFRFGFDSLNSINFPTDGRRITIDTYLIKEDFHDFVGYEPEYTWLIEANWKGALSLGNHAFVGKASYATLEKDKLATTHVSELGGFLNLSGYHKDSLAGNHKAFGAFIYQYDLGRSVLGMTDYPLYLGGSIEAGNVWIDRDDIAFNDLIYAGSLYLGTDTDLGPAALGIGASDDGERTFYLFIGKNF